MDSMWNRQAADAAPVRAPALHWVASILVALVVTAACSGNEYEQAYYSDGKQLTTGPGTSAIIDYEQAYYSDGTQLTTDPDSLTILDPTILDLDLHGDGYPHCGITALTEIADVVFVGRVVGYRERLYAVPADSPEIREILEIPARREIYEGIVLQADAVLLGEMPESGSRITIVEWTLEEGENELYKQTELVERFFPGILAMSTGDGPLYLVYATSYREGTPGADLTLYLQRATSVVQDDGSIDLAGRVSFLGTSACISSEHGEQEWAERDYTLQDARDAAAFVKGLGGRRNPVGEWRDSHS